ncbi:MAG: hypothetical protein ACTHM1_13145 [Solirubrobacteraceae bacterium]
MPTHEDHPWERDQRVERERLRARRTRPAAHAGEQPPPRGAGGPVWSQGAVERGSGRTSTHTTRVPARWLFYAAFFGWVAGVFTLAAAR